MRIYISGPMTGLPLLNYPAFHAAAEQLRAQGHEVFNPADQPDGLTYAEYMRKDIADVLACECVVTLDGWERSRGANIEVSVARAIGVPVLTIEGVEIRETI